MPLRSALVAAVLLLGGCVSSYVLVGRARPAISPDLVQLYLHPPAGKYEEIAILDTSSRDSFSFTAQGKADAVVVRLKRGRRPWVRRRGREQFGHEVPEKRPRTCHLRRTGSAPVIASVRDPSGA